MHTPGQPIRNPMSEVRKMARTYGCGFYKGNGYFYFTGKNFRNSSVMVYSVTELTVAQWESELKKLLATAR